MKLTAWRKPACFGGQKALVEIDPKQGPARFDARGIESGPPHRSQQPFSNIDCRPGSLPGLPQVATR